METVKSHWLPGAQDGEANGQVKHRSILGKTSLQGAVTVDT